VSFTSSRDRDYTTVPIQRWLKELWERSEKRKLYVSFSEYVRDLVRRDLLSERGAVKEG